MQRSEVTSSPKLGTEFIAVIASTIARRGMVSRMEPKHVEVGRNAPAGKRVKTRVVNVPITRVVVFVGTSFLTLTACTSGGQNPSAAPSTPPHSRLTQPSMSGPVDVPGGPLPLPTSDWREGDPAETALLHTTIHREGPCVVGGSVRNPTALVWPAGFTAELLADGVVRVSNVNGMIVATSGQQISVGGGFGGTDIKPWKDTRCVGKYNGVFVIQDPMRAGGG